MKKTTFILAELFLLSSAGLLRAETTVTVDDNAQTVTVSQDAPAAVQTAPVTPTPVVLERKGNLQEFEGEVINVDYGESRIVVRDDAGRVRKVDVKQGMINNYKVDDYVQVSLMADMKEAKMIRVLRDATRYDGFVVRVDPSINEVVVRDGQGKDRTVVVASGIADYFQPGNHVRIYLVPEYKEARLIRVLV